MVAVIDYDLVVPATGSTTHAQLAAHVSGFFSEGLEALAHRGGIAGCGRSAGALAAGTGLYHLDRVADVLPPIAQPR